MWKLLLTSEESKMDTIKELLEAQSDGEELAAQRFNISIDKVLFPFCVSNILWRILL